jgi:anthranilate phosphoribosyltransferase
MVKPLAGALDKLGLNRGLAVCCQLPGVGNMDEFTTAGINHVRGFGGMIDTHGEWKPEDLGFPPANPEELLGGSATENVALLEDILRGDGRQGLADSIILNAAAAFLIVEKVDSLGEGCALAREILYDGTLRAWLEKARAFYQSTESGE